MTEQRKSAFLNIYEKKCGYLKDLQKDIGKGLMEEFISVGFIICGFTRTSKTWRISKLGMQYVEDLNLDNDG